MQVIFDNQEAAGVNVLHLLQQVSAGGLHMMHSSASCLSLLPQQHLLFYALSKPSPATQLLTDLS